MDNENSLIWYNKSRDYLYNFIRLSKFIKLESIKSNKSKYHSKAGYILLGALSIELLLKASIAEITKNLDVHCQNHNLDFLAKKINKSWGCFDNSDLNYLSKLKEYIDWRGKYPYKKGELKLPAINAVYYGNEYIKITSIWMKLNDAYFTNTASKDIVVIDEPIRSGKSYSVNHMTYKDYLECYFKLNPDNKKFNNVVACIEFQINKEINNLYESNKLLNLDK